MYGIYSAVFVTRLIVSAELVSRGAVASLLRNQRWLRWKKIWKLAKKADEVDVGKAQCKYNTVPK